MNQIICTLTSPFVSEPGRTGWEGKGPEAASSSFFRFMRDEALQGNLKTPTLKNHLSTLKHLARFKPDLAIGEVSYAFLCDFEHYLLQQGFQGNTVAKHMKHLKRYLNIAINKELFDPQKYPFRKYRIKYQASRRTHLTPDELRRLEALRPLSPSLRRSLDLFLFSCYTGLRFSDVTRITRDNFHRIDGQLWLVYTSVKTQMHIRLPLSLLFGGRSVALYTRYAAEERATLFGISPSANSAVNKRLLRLSREASIQKRVSFHVARHTHATLLLYDGAHITTVQKLLGHQSVRTTEIYSNIMDMTIVRDLERIAHLEEPAYR